MITELLASCDCAGLAGLLLRASANGTPTLHDFHVFGRRAIDFMVAR